MGATGKKGRDWLEKGGDEGPEHQQSRKRKRVKRSRDVPVLGEALPLIIQRLLPVPFPVFGVPPQFLNSHGGSPPGQGSRRALESGGICCCHGPPRIRPGCVGARPSAVMMHW